MHVEWYGQSAFSLSDGSTTVFIDPFATMTAAADRGIRWDYPAIGDVDADLLLVTHEHLDHNGVEAVGGDPVTLRSVVGHLESPVGEVLGVASEHDEVAGTDRGVNTMFVFHLAGRRVAHLGDLGQRALREEQLAALGKRRSALRPGGRRPDDRRRAGTGAGGDRSRRALGGGAQARGGLLAGDGPAPRYRRRSAWRSGDADP